MHTPIFGYAVPMYIFTLIPFRVGYDAYYYAEYLADANLAWS